MQIALLLLVAAAIVSPVLLPFFLARIWVGSIRNCLQFVVVSFCALAILMMLAFLATDIALNAGVRYWHLEEHECDPIFYCKVFDAAFSSPGLTSLAIYMFLAILWAFGIRLTRPHWFGFRML